MSKKEKAIDMYETTSRLRDGFAAEGVPAPWDAGWPQHTSPAVLGWSPVSLQVQRCDRQRCFHGKDRLPTSCGLNSF